MAIFVWKFVDFFGLQLDWHFFQVFLGFQVFSCFFGVFQLFCLGFDVIYGFQYILAFFGFLGLFQAPERFGLNILTVGFDGNICVKFVDFFGLQLDWHFFQAFLGFQVFSCFFGVFQLFCLGFDVIRPQAVLRQLNQPKTASRGLRSRNRKQKYGGMNFLTPTSYSTPYTLWGLSALLVPFCR